MAEELDEFGIPIKKEQVQSTETVDEFGIPVKKKDVPAPKLESGSEATISSNGQSK